METLYSLNLMNLINLRKDSTINRTSNLEKACRNLEIGMIARCYHSQAASAPNRPRDCRDPRYFVGHGGISGSGKYSNRTEEHLAAALCRVSLSGREFTIDEYDLHFLDYQVPLKARRYDRGIGKIDLFGVVGHTTPCVIELKAEKGKDTPLYALIEGLAYCAIVEANMRAFRAEVYGKFHFGLDAIKPSLLLLAPEGYWRKFINSSVGAAGSWVAPFTDRLAEIERDLGIKVLCAKMEGPLAFRMGLNGEPPTLGEGFTIAPVDLRKAVSHVGEQL